MVHMGQKASKCCSISHTQTKVTGLQSNLNPLITEAHEVITCVCVREGLKKGQIGKYLSYSSDERQHRRTLRKRERRNGGISKK